MSILLSLLLMLSLLALITSAALIVVAYMKSLESDRRRSMAWRRWGNHETIVGFYVRNLFHSRLSRCRQCGADSSKHEGDFCAYCGGSLLIPRSRN
jgi:hypothetical protein